MDSFAKTLNAYCIKTGSTSKVIAEKCDVSASALSRYRHGGRMPKISGKAISSLSCGLAELIAEQGLDDAPTEAEIFEQLSASISHPGEIARLFCERLDLLMDVLAVRNAELARGVGVDPSYLSRIRSGQRAPIKSEKLAKSCAKFFAKRAIMLGACEKVCSIIGAPEVYTDTRRLSRAIFKWLKGTDVAEADAR